MKYIELRQQLINLARQLNSRGLSAGMSGNLSARCAEGVLITPTAMDYQQLTPEDIVLLHADGTVAPDQPRKPSSEWHFHCGIYQARPDAGAVVHAHPVHCTALACSGRAIPAFHYMVAIAGGDNIPLVPYHLFGSSALSEQVVATLHDRDACLLANHGMISLGKNLDQAFKLAVEVESLAHQYCTALTLGDVTLLNPEQMALVRQQFKGYGQRV